MDIDLARTFLAVVESGNFIGAARRLNLTQSTISMRIKSLEEQLGRILFERNRAGASMTPAGYEFEKHATALVRVWEQAKLAVALPEGHVSSFSVGGSFSLWDGFLLKWLPWMRKAAGSVALRAQRGTSTEMMDQILDGTLDMAVMYTPIGRGSVEVVKLFDEELVMVSSEPRPSSKIGKKYVLVNWGPEFLADHQLNFPDNAVPGMFFDLGTMAIDFLLDTPGTGYFPRRVVEPLLRDGRLSLVRAAPSFFYPVYAVFTADPAEQPYATAISGLHRIAAQVAA